MPTHFTHTHATLATMLLLTGFWASASAAAAQDPKIAGEKEAVDNDIVITAQRRPQSSNDVGIAITALGAQQLSDQRVARMSDLSQLTSNVEFRETRPGGNPVITIRGVGLNDFLASSNPSTAVYFDGVYSPNIGTIGGQLFDLQRVEILKGPQSALYGRNSTAGAVNIISARPTDALSGYVTAGYGNYNALDFEGAISGPLANGLTARLSVKTQQRYDGYMTNLYANGQNIGTVHQTSARAQLVWQASDRLSLHGIFAYDHEDDVPGAWTSFGRRLPGGKPGATKALCASAVAGTRDTANLCASIFGYQRTTTDPYTINENDPWNVRGNTYNGTVVAAYTADAFTITSTTGYIDWKQFRVQADSIPITEAISARNQRTWQASEDLQISSRDTMPFIWLAGIYGAIGNTSLLTYNTTPINNANYIVPYDADTKTVQGYGQIDYNITRRLQLTAGARYIYEYTDKSGGTYNDLNYSGTIDASDTRLAYLAGTMTQNALTWKIGLNYKLDNEMMLYASIAHGYKSGGYSAGQASNTLALQPYKGENIYSYEVGFKKSVWNRRIQINGSGFYYDYNNLQTTINTVIGNNSVARLDNIPNASVKGIDVDVHIRPLAGLDISGSAGFLDTRVGTFTSSANILLPAGNRLPNAPKFSASLQARYEIVLTDAASLALAGSMHRQGSIFMDVDNTRLLRENTAATLLDARIELLLPAKGWQAALWVKNIANRNYVVSAYNNGSLVFDYYNMPRTYGFSISKKF